MPSNRILGKTTTSQIHKNHDSKLKLKSKQTERWWFCFLLVHLRRADSSSYSHLLEEKKKTWGHFLCSGSFLLLAASKFNHLLSPPTFALRHPPLSPATYYTTCIFWWFMHLHFPPMMRREKNAHTVWAVMNSWSSAFVHHRRSWGVFRSTKACLKGQSADDSKESKKVFSSSNTEEDMKCTFF